MNKIKSLWTAALSFAVPAALALGTVAVAVFAFLFLASTVHAASAAAQESSDLLRLAGIVIALILCVIAADGTYEAGRTRSWPRLAFSAGLLLAGVLLGAYSAHASVCYVYDATAPVALPDATTVYPCLAGLPQGVPASCDTVLATGLLGPATNTYRIDVTSPTERPIDTVTDGQGRVGVLRSVQKFFAVGQWTAY